MDHYADALFEVRRLNWIIARNKVREDVKCAMALAEMLSLNPCDPDYLYRLEKLKDSDKYKSTAMANNLRIEWARRLEIYPRTEEMLALAGEQTKDMDAAVEAHYELGIIGLHEAKNPWIIVLLKDRDAREFFSKVKAAPDNPWQKTAEEHLARLEATRSSSETEPKE
jgi:hypothetical protein